MHGAFKCIIQTHLVYGYTDETGIFFLSVYQFCQADKVDNQSLRDTFTILNIFTSVN